MWARELIPVLAPEHSDKEGARSVPTDPVTSSRSLHPYTPECTDMSGIGLTDGNMPCDYRDNGYHAEGLLFVGCLNVPVAG